MVFLPHWPIPHGTKPIDLGLQRVRELLDRLGNPETKIPPVIHVAGTNGKGSTIAFLKAILQDAGYKVHRYTSPHLVDFNERIELSGEPISDQYLHEITEQTRIACGDLQTTFFEGTTAAAFLAFSKTPADIVLLETGMGGRLDATNVISKPLMTIITPISFDHMEYLGTTIEQITSEKAGIIKQDVPCVVSWQLQDALQVIQKKCAELQAPSYVCGDDWSFAKSDIGFDFIDGDERFSLPKPSLEGIHQYINAATAVAAIRIMDGFKITIQNICNGLNKTFWPARMQKITSGSLAKLLPQGWEIWLDGAHNSSGAEMLSAHIHNMWQDKPTYLINGRTGQRDIAGFLRYFKDKVELVCGVRVISEPNGETAANIVNGARTEGFEAYECDDLKDAIKLIISKSSKPSRILICGSLYLAGDVLKSNQS